jgi:hypothetical protein
MEELNSTGSAPIRRRGRTLAGDPHAGTPRLQVQTSAPQAQQARCRDRRRWWKRTSSVSAPFRIVSFTRRLSPAAALVPTAPSGGVAGADITLPSYQQLRQFQFSSQLLQFITDAAHTRLVTDRKPRARRRLDARCHGQEAVA